jgi:polysaccharide pyruvyl transferase WcaK-like protein
MNILVLGWYGHNNIGDEAYKLTFPILFPDDNIIFRDKIKQEDLSGIDLIILGGGDVVSPYFINQIKNIPIRKIACSVTVRPGSDFENINVFDKVFVRDIQSFEMASNYLDFKKLFYVPDLAFALEPNRFFGKRLIEAYLYDENVKPKSYNVVMVINSYLNSKERKGFNAFHKLAQDLSEAIDNRQDTNFIFLPFGTQHPADDRVANSIVSSYCSNNNNHCVIYDRLSVNSTLDIISAADVVVSARLHSTIFSILSTTPLIDITHHDKNLGLIRTLELTDWSMPFWKFDGFAFERLLSQHLNYPDRSRLQNYVNKSKEELKNVRIFIS